MGLLRLALVGLAVGLVAVAVAVARSPASQAARVATGSLSSSRSADVGLIGRRWLVSGAPPVLRPITTSAWTRSAGNPILSPVLAWVETAVSELAAVWVDQGVFRMWYSGGWNNPGIGYATCGPGLDPTVAASWVKYASNPVLGQGGSGLAGPAASGRVFRVGTTLHLYVSSGSPLRSTMLHYTSTDGLAWTSASLTISLPVTTTLWGNREVWIEGSTWYMLQEIYGPVAPSGSIWRIYLYSSSDGATWSIQNGGLAYGSLSPDGLADGAWGAPRMMTLYNVLTPKVGANYAIWYHAAPGSGNLPTDIYHATNPNLATDTWTLNGPVLTHSGSGFEVDQVAGPMPLVVGSESYLFYDGDNNPASTAKIGVASAPAQ